jgi:hypothetical protein
VRIYVASSWRNEHQPSVVTALRAAGHEVYDFRNPAPGDRGFHWSDIDPLWKFWSPGQFRESLDHPIAANGFATDMFALHCCEALVLVMPCGRSAHLEAGWAVGAKRTTVVLLSDDEPELMYRMFDHVCCDLGEVLDVFAAAPAKEASR